LKSNNIVIQLCESLLEVECGLVCWFDVTMPGLDLCFSFIYILLNKII